MRTIALILSLLILFSSMQPCSDGNNEHEHQDEISTNHNHQNDSDDTCAFNCVCNCCGISIISQSIQAFDFKLKLIVLNTNSSTYKSVYRFDFNSDIWQPPKLIC